MEVASSSKSRAIKWGELLAVLIPIIFYLCGLSIASFRTLIQHGDAIQNMQMSIKDNKDQMDNIKTKEDDRYGKIEADLMEIKLMLKDKQDRK